mgnify:FL=1
MNSKTTFIINTTCLTIILFLSALLTKINIIPTLLSISIYLILLSTLSHITININDQNKSIKIIKNLFIINLILLIISYVIAQITKYYLKIDNIEVCNILLSLSISFHYIFKIIDTSFKTKISTSSSYYIIITILTTISTLIIYLTNIKDTLSNIILCTIPLISGIINILLITFLNKSHLTSLLEKRTTPSSNKIFTNNIYISFINVINSTYLYISLVYIYYLLNNVYNYNTYIIKSLITNTYLYGYLLLTISINIIIYILSNKYNINNNTKLLNNISTIYYKIFIILIPIIICIIMLSSPIWTLIFNNNKYSYILIGLAIYLFFYILYFLTIKLLNKINNKKNIVKILLIGLLFKILFTKSVISSFYRMGYPLVLGELISTTLSYIVVIIIGNYILKKKYNITFFTSIEKILNIIYNNIILMVELILLGIFVKMKHINRINALLVIIIYSIASILLYAIRLYISKNKDLEKRKE